MFGGASVNPTGLTKPEYGDTGGASRYFSVTRWNPEYDAPFIYMSKASKKEREAGCEDLAPGGRGLGGTITLR